MNTKNEQPVNSSNSPQSQEENYEDQRAHAWGLKQQLDSIPTFVDKLIYWLEYIGPYPSSITYIDGENVPFTLSVEPETNDDRSELNRLMIDYYRAEFAQQKRPVNKFAWQYSEADRKQIAYNIQSFAVLKASMESRLSTATRKEDVLKAELANISAKIDVVASTVNGYNSNLAEEINELRSSLEVNDLFDFAFINEDFPADKAVRLAYVWDIIHYESYLKDTLAQLKGKRLSLSAKAPANDIFTLPADCQQELDKRHYILIYCYEEKPALKKKDKYYNDYILFASPRKRLAYPNNSQSKLRHLIEDIEKILLCLSVKARKQAEQELDTLRLQN